MNILDTKIDPNNITNQNQFSHIFIEKYGDSTNTKRKIKDIFYYMGLNQGIYNLTKIYYDVCLLKHSPGGPPLGEIKPILDRYKSKIIYYKNEPGKIHNITGVWVCEDCDGLGRLEDLNPIDPKYYFVKNCKTCDGMRQKLGCNKFKPFLTTEEKKNDEGFKLIKQMGFGK